MVLYHQLEQLRQSVTMGPGGEIGEGTTRKDFIDSNILLLECCNQIENSLRFTYGPRNDFQFWRRFRVGCTCQGK